MSVIDIYLWKGGRLARDEKLIDLYHAFNVPVYNITSVDGFRRAVSNSGTIFATSFPGYGINLYNRDLGLSADIDLFGQTFSGSGPAFDTNTLRSAEVSGSNTGGAR